jgi:hypothetical protein
MVNGEERSFLEARPGDHLICPFECDGCQFWERKFREPRQEDAGDERVLGYIWRALLDAFWSRAASTVKNNLAMLKEGVTVGKELGIPMYGHIGPWPPLYDHGMSTAIHIFLKTDQRWRDEETMKFASVRCARSAVSNLWEASALGTADSEAWWIGNKRAVSSNGPTDSEWFETWPSYINQRDVGIDAAVWRGVSEGRSKKVADKKNNRSSKIRGVGILR